MNFLQQSLRIMEEYEHNFLQQSLRIVEEDEYKLPATILKDCGRERL
jgi:hypothetical protein